MDCRGRNFRTPTNMTHSLPIAVLFFTLVGACLCKSTGTPIENVKLPSTQPTQTTVHIQPTNTTLKPLEPAETKTTASPTTKEIRKTTKANSAGRTTAGYSTTQVYTSTKGAVKSARKLNTGPSAGEAHSPGRLQERLGAIDCDLPVLPRESRLWRGNETHELNLPVTECAGGGEECPPVVVSWEGSADIQSGDILIVRIADSSLLDSFGHPDIKNSSHDVNATHQDGERVHHTLPSPAVYQVTRQGHVHCDMSEGMLLDITPLDERGAKLITLYDKDLTEGVNLLIVVSESWGSQCVRLKVTVKSDNCGESQDCSGKGVCYTNVSMEGYECQCCAGRLGPHCEERDVCNPSPCLNNGICVDLTQPLNGANYHCLCPYGFTGRKCEKDPCYSEPCLNGGSCMSLAMNGSTTFHCACADGWAGAHCELPTVGGACADKPCVNGICIEQTDIDAEGHEYRCFCLPGYTGEHCEMEYNECESSPCANGGTCTDRVGGFACACGRGFTGNTCQLKVCTVTWNGQATLEHCEMEYNECESSPCANGGTCTDRVSGSACACGRVFTGNTCQFRVCTVTWNGQATLEHCEMEYNECESSPCANGGTCTDRFSGFACASGRVFTGDTCQLNVCTVTCNEQVDLCSPNPCSAQRYCVDHGNSYTCECPHGYVGDECHLPIKSACDNNPCAHGGTCWSGLDSFYCSCRPGYTGKLCEEDFILESVVRGEVISSESRGDGGDGGGAVREVRLPLGLYHDRLHNVYIAAGTLGAAIAIVGVVVTACHCRVNKTYSRLLSRLSRAPAPAPHWLHDKRAPAPPPAPLDTTDMYYTLDFSDSQSSPLIQ